MSKDFDVLDLGTVLLSSNSGYDTYTLFAIFIGLTLLVMSVTWIVMCFMAFLSILRQEKQLKRIRAAIEYLIERPGLLKGKEKEKEE